MSIFVYVPPHRHEKPDARGKSTVATTGDQKKESERKQDRVYGMKLVLQVDDVPLASMVQSLYDKTRGHADLQQFIGGYFGLGVACVGFNDLARMLYPGLTLEFALKRANKLKRDVIHMLKEDRVKRFGPIPKDPRYQN